MNGTRVSRSGAVVAVLLAVLMAAGALALAALGGTSVTTADSFAAVTSPSSETTAGVTGTIAFTRPHLVVAGGDLVVKSSDICVVRSDGTGLTKLAHGSGHGAIQAGLAWSPDGSRLAFVRGQVFDRAGVWVMDADGSAQRLVTRAEKALGPGLAWASDAQLVFSNLERADELALLAVNADGSGLRHVTAGKHMRLDEQPARAPDGTIFFDREVGRSSEICSIRPDGTGFTRVTAATQPTSFSLSPDGKWLLLWNQKKDALVLVPVSGVGTQVVLVAHVSRYITSYAPSVLVVASSWSPDGSQVAFAAAGWKPSALYVVNADGSGLRKVANVSGAWGPVWMPQ
jgi:Tol biopolymer transport system component